MLYIMYDVIICSFSVRYYSSAALFKINFIVLSSFNLCHVTAKNSNWDKADVGV